MTICNYTKKKLLETGEFPANCHKEDVLFILCRTHELQRLRDVFGFDESTVLDCTDLDESVRYTSFDGYDFISMVHIEMLGEEFLLREINLYVSSHYLVLVIPEHDSPRLGVMENKLIEASKLLEGKKEQINGMYFAVFHNLLSDFSDTLELLEDRMQALSDEIVLGANKEQFAGINNLRGMAYTAKKQLRALSYLGDQMLLDENGIIREEHVHYFRNVNTRLKKLYDFSESLYNLGKEMLDAYDSRLTIKTNDTVNKLTVLTLFFGPLTVITGIYGMNFDFMPELDWAFGYPFALGMMVCVSFVLYRILKNNKWL